MGLGRKGDRVAKTPMRVLPPSRGGRTVGDQACPDRPGNTPQQPDVGKALQAPAGRPRFRNSGSNTTRALQLLHQAALPGDAEFLRETRCGCGQ